MKHSNRRKQKIIASAKKHLPTGIIKTSGKLLLVSAAYQIFVVDTSLGVDGVCVMYIGPAPSNNTAPPVYYNPGPSAEQIAAQQRLNTATNLNNQGLACYNRQDWAAAANYFQQALQYSPNDPVIHQNLANAHAAARNTTAHNLNERGVAYSFKNDWANAVKYYQQALEYNPNSPVIRKNLANAQEALDEQRREEESKRADSSAAIGMKDAIHDITNSMPAGTPAPQTGQTPGGGLKFILSDEDSEHAVATDVFGTKKSNPNLQPGTQNTGATGTNTKALDQLPSLSNNDKSLSNNPATSEAAVEKLSAGFDTGAAKNGSLSAVQVEGRAGSMELPEIKDPKLLKDQIIGPDLQHYNQWYPQLQKAKEEVKQAQAAVDNAMDSGAKAVANTALMAAKSKSDGLQIAVESVKSEIEDRMVYIQKFAVPGASPAGRNQPPAPGPGASPAAVPGASSSPSATPASSPASVPAN